MTRGGLGQDGLGRHIESGRQDSNLPQRLHLCLSGEDEALWRVPWVQLWEFEIPQIATGVAVRDDLEHLDIN